MALTLVPRPITEDDHVGFLCERKIPRHNLTPKILKK